MANNIKRINTYDFSKHPFKGPQHDYRTGEADIGLMLNFAPYESGYCFLTVMGTPAIMWGKGEDKDSSGNNKIYGGNRGFDQYDNRGELLSSFIQILEKEFSGLSGIEDAQLNSTDISNNIVNVPVITKNDRNPYNNISMTFTEKSGLPITKFLDLYTKYLYDPYTQAKTYGGRLRSDVDAINESGLGDGYRPLQKKVNNESFTLLYIITDKTCLLVEKAFILYHAYPLNVSWSTIADNTKFDIDKKDITVNWTCQVLDGPLANRLGMVYMRNLFDKVLKKSDLISNSTDGIAERDWHFMADNTTSKNDTYNFYQMGSSTGYTKFMNSYAYKSGLPTFTDIINKMDVYYSTDIKDKAVIDPWGNFNYHKQV